MKRIGLVASLLVLGGVQVTSGCSVSAHENVSSTQDRLWNGLDDTPSDPSAAKRANTVVKILGTQGNCTGTLVTPQLVLTARHCLYGSESSPFTNNTEFSVKVGATDSEGNANLSHATTDHAAFLETPVAKNVADAGRDIALLLMDSFELVNAYAFRPSLISPLPTSPTPCMGNPDCFDGGGFFGNDTLGISGWATGTNSNDPIMGGHDPSTRQFREFGNAQFLRDQYRTGGKNYPYWAQVDTSWVVQHGDSGGPLYVLRAAPTEQGGSGYLYRDVLGVLAAYTFGDNANWTDITREETKTWLIQNVENGTSPLGAPHSSYWLQPEGSPGLFLAEYT